MRSTCRAGEGLVVEMEARSAHHRRSADVRAARHGKRSSFYSDYTFGVWAAGESGEELVRSAGLFGFTDEELARIDKMCVPTPSTASVRCAR